MASGKLVGVTHVGNTGVLSEKHSIRAVFHDFATLNQKCGEYVQSAKLSCHGHDWSVQLYPRGSSKSNTEIEHVSIYLRCASAKRERGSQVKAKYALRVPSAGVRMRGDKAGTVFNNHSKGWKDYAARSDVLDPAKSFLVDRNLTVEADIEVYSDKPPVWSPKNNLHLDMLKVLESANETGDIKFQVGDEIFYAHQCILKTRAPMLANLSDKEESSTTTIPIENVKPSAFQSLLRFAYANAAPEPDILRDEAVELLDMANKFGCKGLKLAAEAELVSSGITVDTAAEMVLLGDAKNCALLKEAAVDFFVANPTAVMASSGWAKVTETAPVMKELMEAAFGEKRSAPGDGDANERDYKRMCVSDLRRKLDEKSMDVDGSREMLIGRLEKGEASAGDDSAEDN